MGAIDEMEKKLLLVKRQLNAVAAAAVMLDELPNEAVCRNFKVIGVGLSEAKALVEKHFTLKKVTGGDGGAWREYWGRTESCMLMVGELRVELALRRSKKGDLRSITGIILRIYAASCTGGMS